MGRMAAMAVLIGIVLVGAAPADAVVRYSSPAGTVTSGGCTDTAGSCRIDWAFNSATMAGDELVLAPGDYGSAGTPLTTALSNSADNVTVHAQPGVRARIFENVPVALQLGGGGTALRDVEVDNAGPTAQTAVFSYGTLERVIGRASNNGSGCGGATVVLDSLCVGRGLGGVGYDYNLNGGGTYDVKLRNLTAIGTGDSSEGIEINASGGTLTISASASNVIARGTRKDVVASNAANGATITLDHSNFATTETTGSGASVTPPAAGFNQSAAPTFIDATSGDYREAAGSPTIDAGLSDPMNGLLDLNGNQRTQGANTDIGAYEFTPPPTGSNTASAPPPGPAQVSVGAVKGTSSGARVTLSCQGQPGQFCVGNVQVTTLELLKGNKVVKLSARKRAKARTGKALVGRASYKIAAGQSFALNVPLNATGRRLEKKFKRLPVTLTVTVTLANGKSATLATQRLILKAARKKRTKA